MCRETRIKRIGQSELEVSPLGMGCWVIGGPWTYGGIPAGWGETNDNESIKAIHTAIDYGINFLDTADCYGCGHSERILGQAIKGKRQKIVIASKFGNEFNEHSNDAFATNADPQYIEKACLNSLKRLGTDYLDLYQFHVNEFPANDADPVFDTLEKLVEKGWIRYYGWSTDDPKSALKYADRPHFVAIQHDLNIFKNANQVLDVCQKKTWGVSIGNRLPWDCFPENLKTTLDLPQQISVEKTDTAG